MKVINWVQLPNIITSSINLTKYQNYAQLLKDLSIARCFLNKRNKKEKNMFQTMLIRKVIE